MNNLITDKNKELSINRNSTFELIRIIAITCVFIHHLILRFQLLDYNTNLTTMKGVFLNSVFVIGVDLFILISGYFGIRLKISKLVKLLLLIFVCQLLSIIFSESDEMFYTYLHNLLFLHSSNSFVPNYIALCLISPLLNKALFNCTYSELKKIMILVTFINVFMGFFLNYYCIDPTGYLLLNFIYLYLLGHFISKNNFQQIKAKYILLIYILSILGTIAGSFVYKSNYSIFAYNNPFVLLSASCVFILLSKINIKSTFINKIASCVFCVFLMEDFIAIHFIDLDKSKSFIELFITCVVFYIGLFVVAYTITYIVNIIFNSLDIKNKLKNIDNYFTIK